MRPDRDRGGGDLGDAPLVDEQAARLDQPIAGRVEHPGAGQVDRGLGVYGCGPWLLLRGAGAFPPGGYGISGIRDRRYRSPSPGHRARSAPPPRPASALCVPSDENKVLGPTGRVR